MGRLELYHVRVRISGQAGPQHGFSVVAAGVFTALAGRLLLYAILITMYRMFFHPLSKYPGPWAGRVNGLYMVMQAIRGRATLARYDLHCKYGSVVRSPPNELSFCDPGSVAEVYGQHSAPCKKADLYRGFTLTGASSVFSTPDVDIHKRMRRAIASRFTPRGVLQYQASITAHIAEYTSIISHAAQSVDSYRLTHDLFEDIMSEQCFAKSFDHLPGKSCPGADDIATTLMSMLFGIFPLARYMPFTGFQAA